MADVYEDEIILCACGCGEPTNMWGALFRSLARDGLTHAEIAKCHNFDRAYVSKIIREPPRVLKGHSGRIYWASPAGVRKREEYAARLERRAAESIVYWEEIESRRIVRFEELAQRERRRIESLVARSKRQIDDWTEAQRKREERIARSALRRAEDARRRLELWEELKRRSELTRQRRTAAKALAKAEAEKRRLERIRRHAIYSANSLDESFAAGNAGEPITRHELVPGGDDALTVLLREQDALTLRRIVGDMAPDDVSRLSAWDLSRLQDKLRDAGFLPSSVQQRERDRLRLPEVHTGAAAKTGSSRGGRRNRAQQQQVTQDHKVRSLPQAARQSHAQLRMAKKQSLQPPLESA